jgi:hypothetical protein
MFGRLGGGPYIVFSLYDITTKLQQAVVGAIASALKTMLD